MGERYGVVKEGMRADDYIRILVASNQREKTFLLSRRCSERDATASRIAAMATTVLPEPTSPCNRRFMGRPAARSRLISAITFNWAPVNSNGNAFTNLSSIVPDPQCDSLTRVDDSERRDAISICIAKNSERTRCSRAASRAFQLSGKWIARIASRFSP